MVVKGTMQRSKPFKICYDFTGCNIAYFSYTHPFIAYKMAQRSAYSAGRPRKYQDGWSSANTRIYVATETLSQWRSLRSELDMSSDNEVAVFLLERHKTLDQMQIAQQGIASER